MAEGIQIRLTHTGLSASNLMMDDIRGESSGGRRGLAPEFIYIPAPTTAVPNPQVTLTYGGLVPMSFKAGDNIPGAGGALTEATDGQAYTGSGTTDDVEALVVHEIALPDVLPGDLLVFSLQRVTAIGGGTPGVEVIGYPLIEAYFWQE